MAEKKFPQTEAEINLFLKNLVVKMPAHLAALGLKNADLEIVTNDSLNYENILTFTTQFNDSKDAYFAFKEDMFLGEPSDVALATPTFPEYTAPAQSNPGIVKRTRALVKRIKAAPGYTEQIGEDLGLIENGPNNVVPADVVPTLSLKALPNSRVEIGFSKKGFDAVRVDYQRKGEVGWQFGGVYTSSPAVHELAPEVPGEPESRSYRAVLLEKNVPVTQYSATYNVVTTP